MKKIIFLLFTLVFSGKTFAFDCTSVQKYSQLWNYNNCGGDPNENKNKKMNIKKRQHYIMEI